MADGQNGSKSIWSIAYGTKLRRNVIAIRINYTRFALCTL
jgi:hypothetical protein